MNENRIALINTRYNGYNELNIIKNYNIQVASLMTHPVSSPHPVSSIIGWLHPTWTVSVLGKRRTNYLAGYLAPGLFYQSLS